METTKIPKIDRIENNYFLKQIQTFFLKNSNFILLHSMKQLKVINYKIIKLEHILKFIKVTL